MPRSKLEIAAISSRSGLKSQSASEIAAKIASKSVAKRVELQLKSQSLAYLFRTRGAEKNSKTPSSQYRYKDLILHDFLVDEKPFIDKCFSPEKKRSVD